MKAPPKQPAPPSPWRDLEPLPGPEPHFPPGSLDKAIVHDILRRMQRLVIEETGHHIYGEPRPPAPPPPEYSRRLGEKARDALQDVGRAGALVRMVQEGQGDDSDVRWSMEVIDHLLDEVSAALSNLQEALLSEPAPQQEDQP
jgi:hypothetical protein